MRRLRAVCRQDVKAQEQVSVREDCGKCVDRMSEVEEQVSVREEKNGSVQKNQYFARKNFAVK